MGKAAPRIQLVCAPDWADYDLIDTGGGAKLERFGPYRFVRPEPQALWQPTLSRQEWDAAHAVFKGHSEQSEGNWKFRERIEPRWVVHYRDLKFWAEPTPFRHLGVFPEQSVHWDWMRAQIEAAQRQVRVLCLFGYTGLATLSAAAAGAAVTHLDASKKIVSWARDNQSLSGLDEKPVRWLIDDALKFVRREARRGSTYDGLVIDPPKFGRGPKGEVWKIEESLPVLLRECRALLARDPLFVVMTTYAIRASAISLGYILEEMVAGLGGFLEAGELAVREKSAGRLLSTALYARWCYNGINHRANAPYPDRLQRESCQ